MTRRFTVQQLLSCSACLLHAPCCCCCCWVRCVQGVPELRVFQAVAAWCEYGSRRPEDQQQQQEALQQVQQQPSLPSPQQQEQQHAPAAAALPPDPAAQPCAAGKQQAQPPHAAGTFDVGRTPAEVHEALQLVRFAFMSDAEQQVRRAGLAP